MPYDRKAFYEYHASMMEPWDGPAAVAFSDGVQVGAVLDRNGLRPSRYWLTDDNFIVVASEVGVLDIPQNNIVKKGGPHPADRYRRTADRAQRRGETEPRVTAAVPKVDRDAPDLASAEARAADQRC